MQIDGGSGRRSLASRTLVWTTGVAPHPLLARRALSGGTVARRRPRITGHVATGGPQPCSDASSAAKLSISTMMPRMLVTKKL